jgi:APA family basic amino acid/polyamine antiporter
MPWVPVTPLLGIGISLLLMASLPWDTWLRLIAWLAIGLVVYFTYGSRNSRVRNGRAGCRAPVGDV